MIFGSAAATMTAIIGGGVYHFNGRSSVPKQPIVALTPLPEVMEEPRQWHPALFSAASRYLQAFEPHENEYKLAIGMMVAVQTAYDDGRLADFEPHEMYDMLVTKACNESSFGANNCGGSKHLGPFQMSENLFLVNLKRYGPAEYANHIKISDTNRGPIATVISSGRRQNILDMRFDPYIASYLVACHAVHKHEKLIKRAGKPITIMGLYMEHMLGEGQAVKLIKAVRHTPNKKINEIFDDPQALGNRRFFVRKGRWVSAQQAYDNLKRFIARQRNDFEKKVDRRGARARLVSTNIVVETPYQNISLDSPCL